MASTPKNARKVEVTLSLDEVTDLDAIFRARLATQASAARQPEQQEREALAHELLAAAITAELGE